MARNLSRDAKLYIMLSGTTIAGATFADTWEVPVLDGFSFTQDSGTQEITISEAGISPTRGMKSYTTSLNPLDWSISTYIKAFTSVTTTPSGASRSTAAEMILWNALVSGTLGTGDASLADVGTSGITTAVTPDDGTQTLTETNTVIDFEYSDVHELLKIDLLFNFDNTTYRLNDCQVNSAELDFSIDSIAQINWSGQGTQYSELSSTDHDAVVAWVAGTDYYPSPIGVVNGCIKNRFTTMVVRDNNPGAPGNNWYTIPITGGSITIDNGITYLTPEELGRVNTSCGSFTGTRSVTGSVTAYLNTDNGETGADESNGMPTGVLINTMLNLVDATSTQFDILIRMGGTASDRARVDLHLGTAHLVMPTINVEDVISTEISFTGQGSTGLEDQDELTVSYYPSLTDIYDEEA